MKTPVKFFARILFVALIACADASAQDQKEQKTGQVTGRVTIDGRAAAGVIVLLSPSVSDPARRMELSFSGATAIRATADENGNFVFSDIPTGRYRATTYALSLVAAPDSKSGGTEKEITVTEGTLEGIDFALIRGGVITGRVTDATGRPMARETVSVSPASDSSDDPFSARAAFANNPSMLLTDDRGVYRIYGLPAGKYILSVGGDDLASFFTGRKTPRTYHPGVADRSRAKPVEVAAGAEATGVDIRISNSPRGYRASGRVIDAGTGKPLPNAIVFCSNSKESILSGGFPGGLSPSGAKGEFQFDNLSSGVYTATAQFVETESEYYSEMTTFEIKDEDLQGIEIKMQRGGSISGFVVVEDSSDPELLAQLPQINLAASVSDDSPSEMEISLGAGRGKILADGSFRVWGLKPGKVHIRAGGHTGPKSLKLARVERDGLDQTGGIELKAGEHISGVRLVFASSSGAIRGRVVIEGGPLPAGTTLIASVENTGDEDSEADGWARVDSTGNFIIENLLPGTYEVSVRVASDERSSQQPKVTQTVTVAKDITTEVTMVLNLKTKNN